MWQPCRPVKPLLLVALLLVVTGSLKLPAHDRTIRVGYYDNRPLIFMQDGQAAGLFAEILQQIAEKEGWKLEWRHAAWSVLYDALVAGDLDVLPVVAWNESRASQIAYSDEALISNWGIVYTRNSVKVESFLDLQHRRVAILENDTHSNNLANLLARFGVDFYPVVVGSYADMQQALLLERADAGVFNYVYATSSNLNKLFTQTLLYFNPIQIHYAVPKGDPAGILQALNDGLAAVKQDEIGYRHLVNRFLGMDHLNALPGWLPLASSLVLLALLLVLVFNLWLRNIVRQRTGELEEANRAIAKREAYLNALLDCSPLAMQSLDTEGRIVRYNPAAERLFGWTAEEAIGHYPPFVSENNIPEFLELLEGMKRGEVYQGREIIRQARNGESIPLSLWSAPVRDSDGQLLGIIASLEDIRSRKRDQAELLHNLEEKQVLLREIHHRVKNNLTVISSLLNLQAQRISSPEQAIEAFRQSSDRVMAMALVHMELYESGDFSRVNMKNYILGIGQHLGQVFGGVKAIELQYELEDVYLAMQKALPCGLILNELVTNACKYAYPADGNGPVRIKLWQAAGRCTLVVEDDGIGIPDHSRETTGLGMTLIRGLTEQLDGSLAISASSRDACATGGKGDRSGNDGCRIELCFPL